MLPFLLSFSVPTFALNESNASHCNIDLNSGAMGEGILKVMKLLVVNFEIFRLEQVRRDSQQENVNEKTIVILLIESAWPVVITKTG